MIGLGLIAFLAGVIGASIGPGGVLLIASLYAFTALTPTEIAGTSSMLFVPGLMLAAIAYSRSGDIHIRLAAVLGISSVVGTVVGVRLNQYVSELLFGVLLSILLVWAGLYIFYRETVSPQVTSALNLSLPIRHLCPVGFFIGISGGVLGVGGPVLAVPALILLGIPIVPAVAAAQIQGLFITISTSANYVASDSVVFNLVGVLIVPMLSGVIVGWWLAQRVCSRMLRYFLGVLLVCLGVVLLGNSIYSEILDLIG